MEENQIEEDDFADARDPFASLSSSVEEGKEELDFINTRRGGTDSRVCICGHPVSRHKLDPYIGIKLCSPNAQRCPCKRRVAVLKASDLRVFLRSTRGEGWLHALGQGLLAAQEKGVKLNWLMEDVCELCNKSAKVMPASLNERKKADVNSGMNYLICDECMAKV